MIPIWEHLLRADNLPILILLAGAIGYGWYGLRKGLRNDRPDYRPEEHAGDTVQVWPYLVRVEFLAAITVLTSLIVWSILIDAPLEGPANPAITPNPSKAPWYFVGLQELLVYFDPWIAGVVLPTLIIAGLILIPYIDPNPKGNGRYSVRSRPFAIPMFLGGFFILWIALIVIGTFWRGPGWYFVQPWEPWDTHRVAAITNVDFTERFFGIPTWLAGHRLNPVASIAGGVVVLLYYGSAILYRRSRRLPERFAMLEGWKYSIVAFLFLTMAAVPLKILLRILVNIKYIWVTPWFNI